MARLVLSLALCLLTLGGALAQPSGEARAWCHLCPWNALNNLAHNRRDFPLGLGMETQPGMAPRTEPQYLRDYIYECLSAAGAGVDAFALDLIVAQPLENWTFALDGYLKAAETVTTETGRPFYVAPCLDGADSRDLPGLIGYLMELMRGRVDSPAWARYGGRPVIWTYGSGGMTIARWALVLEALAREGFRPIIILDAGPLLAAAATQDHTQATVEGLAVEDMAALAEIPVALYLFRTDTDLRPFSSLISYLRRRHPDSVAAQLTIGTIWPGYWSLGSGWYVDSLGTGLIRQTFERFSGARWLTVTTWNDFYETTQFQPSVGFGTGRLDLLHALLSRWRRETPWPAEPRVYLWQPNETQAGDPLVAQVVCLTPADTGPVEARVTLCNVAGKPTEAEAPAEPPTWTTLSGAGVRSADFILSPAQVPATNCQYLLLEVRLPGQPGVRQVSEPICVWPAGYHPRATLRGTIWRLGEQERGPQQVSITMDGPAPTRLQVTWPQGALPPGSRLQVRQNFNLINLPGEAASPLDHDMGATYGEGRPPGEVYHPVPQWQRWGFYDTVAVLPDGALRWSEPRWVPPAPGADLECAGWWPMDDGSGTEVRDLSPYGHTATFYGTPTWVTPGRVGQGCLLFDGKVDALDLPGGRFPPGPFTFRAWIKPHAECDDCCLFAEINGCLVLTLAVHHGLTARRTSSAGEAVVSSDFHVPSDQWTRVAVTYDLGGLYLYANGQPIAATPCTGLRPSNLTALGCNPFGTRGEFFAGYLDDVSIDARALSADEIMRDAMQ